MLAGPRHRKAGVVVGKEEIRSYWTRQWKEFDPHVEPLEVIKDKYRGTPSSVTEEQFARALSVRSVKAPELRRRVRAALKPFGYSRVDALGDHHCHQVARDFSVNVDFGGRSAQLRYYVSFPEFQQVRHLNRFGFEHALGFGFQDWDFIVEENVDDVFALFTEVVAYSVELPERIRRSVQ